MLYQLSYASGKLPAGLPAAHPRTEAARMRQPDKNEYSKVPLPGATIPLDSARRETHSVAFRRPVCHPPPGRRPNARCSGDRKFSCATPASRNRAGLPRGENSRVSTHPSSGQIFTLKGQSNRFANVRGQFIENGGLDTPANPGTE